MKNEKGKKVMKKENEIVDVLLVLIIFLTIVFIALRIAYALVKVNEEKNNTVISCQCQNCVKGENKK